jgi:hypothetical protein
VVGANSRVPDNSSGGQVVSTGNDVSAGNNVSNRNDFSQGYRVGGSSNGDNLLVKFFFTF